MEADWEIEVGGGAPVIEAVWPGFVDLRRSPDAIVEISEAAAFPALAVLLLALNEFKSQLWTAKCDLWEPDPNEVPAMALTAAPTAEISGDKPVALACYVALLPLEGLVFRHWEQAEALCREWVKQLDPFALPGCRVELVVRQAIAGELEGFGVTAYLGAAGPDRNAAAQALAAALNAFLEGIPSIPAAPAASKLQWKGVGE